MGQALVQILYWMLQQGAVAWSALVPPAGFPTMKDKPGYGQYCPLSMAAEILCNRWTMLVLRELLEGSTGFNEISRGVPLMSRTLLLGRLRQLDEVGLVTREDTGAGRQVHYRLTAAGNALGSVVRAMAEWGQEWIDVEPSLKDVDTDFLMWDIRRNVRPLPEFPRRLVVRFHFPDAPEKKQEHWLIFENGEVDICYIDPGYDVDIQIEAGIRTMTKVWMGWQDFSAALRCGDLQIEGPRQFTKNATTWLGLSSLAGVRKQPPDRRVRPTSIAAAPGVHGATDGAKRVGT
jgi:DNA-binding HxlR family transcriptional regulator